MGSKKSGNRTNHPRNKLGKVRMNVYLPDYLAEWLRGADKPASHIISDALEQYINNPPYKTCSTGGRGKDKQQL